MKNRFGLQGQRTITVYQIDWDNGHASDTFPQAFSSKKEAIAFARNWKREMVSVEETPEARKDAREDYQWDLRTTEFFVEKDDGAWVVFDKADCPRQALFKECPFKHVIPTLLKRMSESKVLRREANA